MAATVAGCGGSSPAADPTAVPVPTVDYNAGMSAQITAVGAFLDAASPMLDNPQFGDQAWNLQVIEQAAAISTAYEQIAALPPPGEQLSKHLAVLSGVGDCAASMKVLTLATDTNRPDFVPVSVGLINRCAAKLRAAGNQ